jgi:hypothetical protein
MRFIEGKLQKLSELVSCYRSSIWNYIPNTIRIYYLLTLKSTRERWIKHF